MGLLLVWHLLAADVGLAADDYPYEWKYVDDKVKWANMEMASESDLKSPVIARNRLRQLVQATGQLEIAHKAAKQVGMRLRGDLLRQVEFVKRPDDDPNFLGSHSFTYAREFFHGSIEPGFIEDRIRHLHPTAYGIEIIDRAGYKEVAFRTNPKVKLWHGQKRSFTLRSAVHEFYHVTQSHGRWDVIAKGQSIEAYFKALNQQILEEEKQAYLVGNKALRNFFDVIPGLREEFTDQNSELVLSASDDVASIEQHIEKADYEESFYEFNRIKAKSLLRFAERERAWVQEKVCQKNTGQCSSNFTEIDRKISELKTFLKKPKPKAAASGGHNHNHGSGGGR